MKKMKSILTILLLFFCVTLSAQTKTTKPKNGEGIHALLRRNGFTDKKHYDEFLKLNADKLGKNKTLKMGVSYVLPSGSGKSADKPVVNKKGKEPLFGPKLAEYEIKSNRLKGACFYLSSGHGGLDSGAKTTVNGNEIHEDEYAYDITLRLARNLMMEGATVHIIIQDAKDGIRDDTYLSNSTRETCMGDPIPDKQKERLKQRCDKINQLYKKDKEKYKRAIFVHIDSRPKNQRVDVYFFHHPNSTMGERLSKNMLGELRKHYKKYQPNKNFNGKLIPKKSLYVLANATPASVYAELGNLQNEQDQKRFLMASNRQYLADWMCLGIINDYQKSKK